MMLIVNSIGCHDVMMLIVNSIDNVCSRVVGLVFFLKAAK